MMWERFQQTIERQGGQVQFNQVIRPNRAGNRIKNVLARRNGQNVEIEGDYFLSSMPISELILRMDPPPPYDVVWAARRLHYRAILIVGLIVNQKCVFPDNWIYVHSPEVQVGDIQNFKNWSPVMIPNPAKSGDGIFLQRG